MNIIANFAQICKFLNRKNLAGKGFFPSQTRTGKEKAGYGFKISGKKTSRMKMMPLQVALRAIEKMVKGGASRRELGGKPDIQPFECLQNTQGNRLYLFCLAFLEYPLTDRAG